MRACIRKVKDLFRYREAFALHFDLYPLDALSGSTGVEKTESYTPNTKRYIVNRIIPADLRDHRSYAFYCEMIALQDENHKQEQADSVDRD